MGSTRHDQNIARLLDEGVVTEQPNGLDWPAATSLDSRAAREILRETAAGLYCVPGDFYVDPWEPVARAVVTHAHSDHARGGCGTYLSARAGRAILQMRLGSAASYQFVDYGEVLTIGGVRLSLHPAGHMTGAAQVRLEYAGYVIVITGDFKRQADPTCATFEPLRCHTLVTESTFGLPIYRWPEPDGIFDEINAWWRTNQQEGRTSLLLGYTVGKAQRLLAGIDASIGPVFAHGGVVQANQAYEACGVTLPQVRGIAEVPPRFTWSEALIVAPPSVQGSPWLRRFGDVSMGMASGWMQIRGICRRRNLDRGFVISDHVDWQGLLATVQETSAEEVWVTHGYTQAVARYLAERGLRTAILKTQYVGELDAADAEEAASSPTEERA